MIRGRSLQVLMPLLATLAVLAGAGFASTAQPATIDLQTDDVDFRVVSRDGQDRLGSRNAIATGDFNNDGVTDFLLGVPGGDGPEDTLSDQGEVYIIFGREDLPSTFSVDGIPGPDVVIFGRDIGDQLGSSVAAGDVNGDGIDDVILSAPGGNGSANRRTDVGEVIVLNGRNSWADRIRMSETQADLIVYNNRQQSRFGEGLTTADLNGDAIPDLVISDPSAQGSAGHVYVLNGRRDLPQRLDIGRAGNVDITLVGGDSGDQLGLSVVSGDLNGDAIEDLVIAAPLSDGPQNDRPDGGTAFVLLGREDLPSTIDLGETSPDATIYGADTQNRLGRGLDIGDLNGDGLPDIIVGAPGTGGPNTQLASAGAVYIVNGASTLQTLYDMRDGAFDARIDGARALENAGAAVAASDIDRDDQLDLLIGAPAGGGPNGGRAEAGTVYVVRNDNGGFGGPMSLGSAADLVVYGASSGDALGTALAAGAVTNGNEGVLLMGAPGVDSAVNGPNAGIVYLLRAADLIQPNQAPNADAGANQTVNVGDTVDLDASGSSDPEGGELSFSWTLTSAPSDSEAELANADAAQPSFTADVAGEYVAELTVEDEQGATATDSVRITAEEADDGNGDGEPPGNRGDCDGNGEVNILDARCVCEAVLGDGSLSDEQRQLVDVAPPEGEITLEDAQWIAEAAVGRRSLGDSSSQAITSPGSTEALSVLAAEIGTLSSGALRLYVTGVGVDAVQMQVFDLSGRERFDSGWQHGQTLTWQGLSASGSRLANGVYLATIEVRGVHGRTELMVRKIALLR